MKIVKIKKIIDGLNKKKSELVQMQSYEDAAMIRNAVESLEKYLQNIENRKQKEDEYTSYSVCIEMESTRK